MVVPEAILSIFLIAVSPFIGSFLANFAVRWPEGESVAAGRSRCRSCGQTLGPLDLVPLASWLMSRGTCRYCGAPVSAVYPLTETLAFLLSLWAVMAGPIALAPVSMLLGWVLLTLAVVDARSFLLPDRLTLPLIPAGLVVDWAMGGIDLLMSGMLGALLGGGLSACIAIFYQRFRKRAGLGWGDVKLLAGAGAWTGVSGVPAVLFLGACLGLLVVAVMRFGCREISRTTPLPFGPFLAAAFWIVWLHGPIIQILQ